MLFSVPGLATVALLLVAAFLFYGRRRRRLGEPPIENGWIPLLGLVLEYSRNPSGFLLSRQQKYGDVFTVNIAGKYITFLMDPFQFQNVIRQGRQLDFSEFADDLSSRTFDYPYLKESTFPQLRVNLHRIYQILQGKALDKLTDSMMGNLQHVFKWKFSQATDWVTEKMYQFCCSIMFEASFMTLYGRDPAADGRKVISEIRDKFTKFDAKFPYLVINIPIALLGDTKKVRKELIHILSPNNIVNRKEVSEVVQARQNVLEQYELLQDYDKAAHHFAFLWASIANTIPATFWTMYYLVRHPKALETVRDEIDHLLQLTGQRKEPGYSIHLTREQLDNLVYLGSAVQESLRMCSASMNIRVVQEDFILKLEGDSAVSLRKGDWVALYPQTLHKDPEIYKDPEEFKFDRFVENGKEKTTFYKKGRKLKYYLMPFGSGVSKCPGRFFAINEIKQFLALLVTYFDMEFIEDKNLKHDNSRSGLGILLPDSDIRFRCKLRF
ncbi:25-hydroxycholesterol 7-alpha-hydroxylase [Rhinatrema bivittatum]|uniref:25-hydroxycholesterol 7-alpha-hydroxylase n=1 Tax=Rhinatrema bivittatum TaxID=194408 RepID=UPI00112DC2F0|nr:25-hydroxycholesterol 7-alpha-hydroxylase [Rhinatrema bivittatum]